MTFLSFPPQKKKTHSWQATAEDSPLPRAHEKITESPDPTSPRLCRTKKKQMWMWKAAIYIAVLWGYWMHMCYWDIWWTLNVLNGFSKLRGPFFSSILLGMMIMGGIIISLSKNPKKKHYYSELFFTIFTIFTSSALKSPLSPPPCQIFAKWRLWGSLPAQEPRHEGVPARFADVPRTPVAAFLDESWWIMDINSDQLWFMVGCD